VKNDSFSLSVFVKSIGGKAKPWRLKGRYRFIKRINNDLASNAKEEVL
jgi:hypothetical protein